MVRFYSCVEARPRRSKGDWEAREHASVESGLKRASDSSFAGSVEESCTKRAPGFGFLGLGFILGALIDESPAADLLVGFRSVRFGEEAGCDGVFLQDAGSFGRAGQEEGCSCEY
ncbi:hypothetical protein B296_00023305 [Ensete ventricosum]|uniref:Uncharacterized protein n=1 Tax=Ensete ventricosum TaxID=4639 RepID=A0A427AW01_ENSVE|nr:hypothetical protein B296_00023305 [Ensete ventricosum]